MANGSVTAVVVVATQPLLSVTCNVYTPLDNELILLVVCPNGDQLYVKPPVPPL